MENVEIYQKKEGCIKYRPSFYAVEMVFLPFNFEVYKEVSAK
jgi:hypothetical protein